MVILLNSVDTGRIGCCAVGGAFDGTSYLMIGEDSKGHKELDYRYQQVSGCLFIQEVIPLDSHLP